MDKTTQLPPTIADLLEEFFAGYKPAATDAVRQRIDRVRANLLLHLEQEGQRQLTTPQLAILAAERSLDNAGAFARTMHAPELYYVLAEYLDDEFAMDADSDADAGADADAGDAGAQRGIQVDVVAALASFLWSRRLISQNNISECALIEFEIAVDRARKPGQTTRDHGRSTQ